MNHWLFKSEPNTFSIDDLIKRPKQTEHWDGVRNFQVRNLLKSTIKKGDLAFFYHSSCSPPGVAGIMEVVKEGYPDFTSWDPKSRYYDPDVNPDNPRWYMVDVKFVEKFPHYVPLEELKSNAKLKKMTILRKGNRLSITAVTEEEWKTIIKMGRGK